MARQECRLDRINEQPPVLLGLSNDELVLAIALSGLAALVLCSAIAAVVWKWWGGFIGAPIATTLLVRFTAGQMRRMKLGKPANFYPLLLKKRFDDLLGSGVSNHIGPWFTLRRNRYEGRE